MKKIIDEHGRVFGKVSVIDFLVVLIVLVLGAALYVKYNVLEATSVAGKTDTIAYAITIYGAREYTANGIRIGDAIYEKSGSGGHSVGRSRQNGNGRKKCRRCRTERLCTGIMKAAMTLPSHNGKRRRHRRPVSRQ